MTDIAYFTFQPQRPVKRGQFVTDALVTCSICDHVVETMGGPGDGSLCPECVTLIKRGQIKIDRERVVAALQEKTDDQ